METPDQVDRRLRRQSKWLKEQYIWLLDNNVLLDYKAKPRALDVGCGLGYVMDIFKDRMVLKGVDLDEDMVSACQAQGLDVVQADGHELPFEDDSFDIVYCTFVLMWSSQPVEMVKEFARVSRKWVLCLGEADHAGMINHPVELDGLKDIIITGLEEAGADPYMGRKLQNIFRQAGLISEIGIHQGAWDLERARVEFEDEKRSILSLFDEGKVPENFQEYERVWKKSLDNGSYFQFNPIFYAIGTKR